MYDHVSRMYMWNVCLRDLIHTYSKHGWIQPYISPKFYIVTPHEVVGQHNTSASPVNMDSQITKQHVWCPSEGAALKQNRKRVIKTVCSFPRHHTSICWPYRLHFTLGYMYRSLYLQIALHDDEWNIINAHCWDT